MKGFIGYRYEQQISEQVMPLSGIPVLLVGDCDFGVAGLRLRVATKRHIACVPVKPYEMGRYQ